MLQGRTIYVKDMSNIPSLCQPVHLPACVAGYVWSATALPEVQATFVLMKNVSRNIYYTSGKTGMWETLPI